MKAAAVECLDVKRAFRRLAIILPLGVVFLTAVAWAQAPPADPRGPYLFPPEMVMSHAEEIGLGEKQRSALVEAVQSAQPRLLEAQLKMQGESQRMARLFQAQPVDEAAVLAQADKLMGVESDAKRTQLSLLVRIKNLLSETQQEKLRRLNGSR